MVAATKPETLTRAEAKRLAQLEVRIETGLNKGQAQALAVAKDLRAIHDEQLWRATHVSFGAYFEQRFHKHRSQAYQWLNWAWMSSTLDVDLPNYRVAAELAGLPESVAQDVAERAREKSGEADPTAEQYRQAMAEAIKEEEERVAAEPPPGGAGGRYHGRGQSTKAARWEAACKKLDKIEPALRDEERLDGAARLLPVLQKLLDEIPGASAPIKTLRTVLSGLGVAIAV